MKKVVIATFATAHNFGAMLQAYALRRAIQRHCAVDSVEIVESEKSVKTTQTYQIINLTSMKRMKRNIRARYLLRQFCSLPFYFENRKGFSRYAAFSSDILRAKVVPDDLHLQCGYFVVGSDQVWNPNTTKGLCDLYFGTNVMARSKISYAASAGNVSNLYAIRNELICKCNNLDAITTRESKLAAYISGCLGRAIDAVIDPTLLLDKSDYIELETQSHNAEEKQYLLAYNKSRKKNKTYYLSKRISKLLGIPVIEVSSSSKVAFSEKDYKRVADVGPSEFLFLLHHAQCVVTDSFHGVALSIVYRKSFYCVPTIRQERLDNLLNLLKLESRMIDNLNEFQYCETDYSDSECVLSGCQTAAYTYLKSNLAKNGEN